MRLVGTLSEKNGMIRESKINCMNNINSSIESGELDFSLEFSGQELQLIQHLKLGNWEKDAALREAFVAWVDQCQVECAKDTSPRSNVDFLMKKAKLLYMAGLEGEAWADLIDARTLADNLGEQAIVDEANKILLALADS
jgi:hypothetical protein